MAYERNSLLHSYELFKKRIEQHTAVMSSFSLMIHSGADLIRTPERREGSLRRIIEAGGQ
jgi:hypothetical protein